MMASKEQRQKVKASFVLQLLGILVLIAASALFIASLPEIKRYLKLKSR